MNFQDDIMDPTLLRLEGDFEAQVNQLLMLVRLTRTEVENLQHLVVDVERTLSIPWPGCRVYTFGSIVTGLGIATSDIDCYVALPQWVNMQNNLVFKAKAFLQAKQFIFAELFAIPMAKVPIVKCLHIPTNRHCDINFTSKAGVENSKLLAYLLHVDPRALPLAVLIKYWSKVHNLTGTNLMANYALTMLVVFYLQHLKILPSVHVLQQTVPHYIVNGWNSAFDDNHQQSKADSTVTLYQLLGGFFDYYSNFDFDKQIVSTYLGRAVEKECFKQIDSVPEEYDLYKYNISNKVCQEMRVDTKMCVQDPFEHARNCSVSVHYRLFDIVLRYFKKSAQLFYEKESGKYLTAILTIVQMKADNKVIRNSQNRIHKPHQNKIMKERKRTQNHVKQKIRKNVQMMYTQLKKRN